MEQPRAGTHYPRSVGEFQAWFRTDGDCLNYLERLRWPTGFACPDCGYYGGWRLGDGSATSNKGRRRTTTPARVLATGPDGPLAPPVVV